ncbi:hypothetical protein M0R45_025417 [Rubus argutus]|uniref:Uncharacterized protein n=1 Tax=Rubus argutus TaxID=59490 RepID=A0AAW1WX16_RUBAR
MSLPFSLVFQVNRSEPQLITPAKPTPRETKMLSDIDDQEGFRFQVPVIIVYKNNPSMSKRKDPVQVFCSSRATADVTLEELGDAVQSPCPLLEEFLCNVPGSDGILGCPLLLIQVTLLRCGGFIFALRLNHTICDAAGLVQFLNTVGEMAQGKNEPSIPPVWEREVLNARDPPRITRMHHEFEEIIDYSDQSSAAAEMVQKSFYFGPKEITALKKHLPLHLSTCSRFDLITSCLWKCRTVALEHNPKQVVRISCIVNARGKSSNVRLPLGYYGNAFAYPAAVSEAKQLCENPLGYALELVMKAKAEMNEEYLRSVADLMVIRGRPLYTLTGNFIVSDTSRSGFGEIDFGWGSPAFSGPAKALSLVSFYSRLKKENEMGFWCRCLPLKSMERFQQELKRMTSLENMENIDNINPLRLCQCCKGLHSMVFRLYMSINNQ